MVQLLISRCVLAPVYGSLCTGLFGDCQWHSGDDRDGCQAAALIAGDFRKDVPRYLHNRQYEAGWDNGFRQCQAMQEHQDLRDYRARHWDDHEEQWQQEKDRDAATQTGRKRVSQSAHVCQQGLLRRSRS